MKIKNDTYEEYNNLINEVNEVVNEVEEIDKEIIYSNESINLAKKNVKGALIVIGLSFIVCTSTIIFRVPTIIPLIFGGSAVISFNWAISAANYINIKKNMISEFEKEKESLLKKHNLLKKKLIDTEKSQDRKIELSMTEELIKKEEKNKIKIKKY